MKNIISIDFKNTENQSPEVIDSRSIKIPSQRVLMWVEKKVNFKFHELSIKNISYPNSIKVRDKSKLLQIQIRELNLSNGNSERKTTSRHKDFRVNNYDFPYDILLYPSQISDYTDLNEHKQTLSFVLEAIPAKGRSPIEVDYSIQLLFSKAVAEPRFEFQPEQEFVAGREYSPDKVRLGTIQLKSDAPVTYCDPMECSLSLAYRKDKKTFEHIVDFSSLEEITESRPIYNTQSNLRLKGQAAQSVLQKERQNGTLHLANIFPNNTISIPVMVDLGKLQNPDESAKHEALLSVSYKMGANKEAFTSIPIEFTVTQDTLTTELKAEYKDGRDQEFSACVSNGTEELSESFLWEYNNENIVQCFAFRFGNHAQNNSGGRKGAVAIRNFMLKVKQPTDSLAFISPQPPYSLDNIFTVNDSPLTDLPETLLFENRPRSYTTYRVEIHNDRIKAIDPDQAASLEAEITFDYCILQADALTPEVIDEAFSKERKAFKYTIQFKIEENPGPYWLALDFGTSASVGAFDAGEDPNKVELLNLQESMQKRWEIFPEDRYSKENVAEYGSPFIDSTIVLRKDGEVKTDDFEKDIVYLAPLIGEWYTPGFYLLPYVKSLIGGSRLPEMNGELKDFSYVDNENEYGKVSLNKEEDRKKTKGLLQIVIRNTYNALLRDFVIPQIEAQDKRKYFNKIVLSIPNTFSPKHIDFIKRRIMKEFDYIKENHIVFISESDAVACHYLSSWAQFNPRSKRADRANFTQGDEYVLVYDLGAGTLDLTYLRIRREKQNKEISIIGKLGKSTAGNYFDYIIAQELVNQLNEKSTNELKAEMFKKEGLIAEDRIARKDFKMLVRNEIKPILYYQSKYTIEKKNYETVAYTDIQVDLQDLGQRPMVEDFIKRNTTELLDNFFSLFKKVDGKFYQKGEIPLNTVLLTGRGVQIPKLKARLKKELENWSSTPNIYLIDDLSKDDLKSAVVKGALQFAKRYRSQSADAYTKFKNKNLHARYGVLYIDPKELEWTFKELLNPQTKHLHHDQLGYEPHVKDGVTIYEYDTDVYDVDPGNDNRGNFLNLLETNTVFFVQSFAADTAQAKRQGREEYITTMFKAEVGGNIPRSPNVSVQVIVNDKNEMIVTIGAERNEPKDLISIDVETSEVFRMSMWPFLE